jgi:hypothetical protein
MYQFDLITVSGFVSLLPKVTNEFRPDAGLAASRNREAFSNFFRAISDILSRCTCLYSQVPIAVLAKMSHYRVLVERFGLFIPPTTMYKKPQVVNTNRELSGKTTL